MSVNKPTVRRLFERVSQGSEVIDRPKVVNYLKELGVGGGLLGGQKVAKGADAFMAKLDVAPKDGKVTWEEFVAESRHLLPPALRDGQGRLNPALVPQVFKEITGPGKSQATREDISAYVASKVTGGAALFAGTIADASSKLALDALDADKDGKVGLDDLMHLVSDINAHLDPAGQG